MAGAYNTETVCLGGENREVYNWFETFDGDITVECLDGTTWTIPKPHRFVETKPYQVNKESEARNENTF